MFHIRRLFLVEIVVSFSLACVLAAYLLQHFVLCDGIDFRFVSFHFFSGSFILVGSIDETN